METENKTQYGNFYPLSKHMRRIIMPVIAARKRAERRAKHVKSPVPVTEVSNGTTGQSQMADEDKEVSTDTKHGISNTECHRAIRAIIQYCAGCQPGTAIETVKLLAEDALVEYMMEKQRFADAIDELCLKSGNTTGVDYEYLRKIA